MAYDKIKSAIYKEAKMVTDRIVNLYRKEYNEYIENSFSWSKLLHQKFLNGICYYHLDNFDKALKIFNSLLKKAKTDTDRYAHNTTKQGRKADRSFDAVYTDGMFAEILIASSATWILKNPRTISRILGIFGITSPKTAPVIAFLV